MQANSSSKNEFGTQILWFIIFAICGIISLGPIQYGNIPLASELVLLYKITIPLLLFGTTIIVHRSQQDKPYWSIFLSFSIGSFAFFVAYLRTFIISLPAINIENIVFGKVATSISIVATVLILWKLSGKSWQNLLLQTGNIKQGLGFGFLLFTIFASAALPLAITLFDSGILQPAIVVSWIPWIIVFVFANSLLEEVVYRGLFLNQYAQVFSPKAVNLLQGIVFASIHLNVTYTVDSTSFLVIVFFLGLAWGLLAQKTDSLFGSILFHAGADVAVVLSIFSAL